MRCRVTFMVFIGVWLVWCGLGLAQSASSVLATADDILSPKEVAARKGALEAELEALERSEAPKEERDKARAPLDETLSLIRDLEQAWERRDQFRRQHDTLTKRLQELASTQRALEARPPSAFPQATEALRDQYDAELRAAQTAIQDLLKQDSLAEARLSAIPHELEQRRTERPKLQQSLDEARRQASQISRSNKPEPAGDVSRLEIQLQLLVAEVQMLEAERQWLTERGPLHDLMLRVEQTKLLSLRQDLEAISQALSQTLQEERAALSEKAVELEQAIGLAKEPVERLQLSVQLETVRMRQATANYRQQLAELNQSILTQEQITSHERQDADRLAALFGKFSSGESGGGSLLLAFERLRQERQRFRDDAVKQIEAKLRDFTPVLYQVEDQLYYHDQHSAQRLKETFSNNQAVPIDVRQAFDEQKTALREQQQVLAMTAQAYTTLLSLHREYRQLLDDSYYAALAKIFWLRDAERLSLSVMRDILAGVGVAMIRLHEMIRAEPARLRAVFSGAIYLWIPAGLLLAALFWVAQRLYIALRRIIVVRLSRNAERELPCGLFDALLMVARAAVWPAYLLLLAWARNQLILLAWFRNQYSPVNSAADALVSSGLEVSAMILFGALLSRDMLRPTGWGRQFWGWRAELCRFLYRIVWVACLAALALLLPRHLLLSVPGEGEVAAASLALTRFLLLLFQTIVLVLAAIAGWRQNPLMEERLTHSQQQEGLLWRLWPFIYLLILAGLAGVITLDALGYRYAARFVWLRSLESASVLLLWRLLLVLLIVRLLHGAVDFIVRLWFNDHRGQSAATAPVDQVFRVVYTVGNTVMAVLACSAILEIWGVSVSWFLKSPLGVDLLRRGGVIAGVIAVMVLVMKISKVVTEYLVQPRTTPDGAIQQPNRKFRTMVPLSHTLLKFGVVFGAIIVVLQQLSVAIGPILTGVGIFGLAVGFASQSLIKDVINGLFILFEDSLSVGDIVTLRGISGLVEKVTLRAVTVRDLEGNVHVIPNSTLDLITNMTKEFSRHVIDVGVAYREDVDRVMEILKEVGEDLQNDPTFGWDMMRPLEIMGLHAFADSAVVIRTRLWTLPGSQFRLGREFRRRLKRVFDERGVEIPFPHRTLYWGMPKEGPQPPIHIAYDASSAQRAENGRSKQAEPAPSPGVEEA